MKSKFNLLEARLRPGGLRLVCLVFLGQALGAGTLPTADCSQSKWDAAIAWSQIGSRAEASYKGEGLAVSHTEGGALLRCVFQRLEGQATTEGLWLVSRVAEGSFL